MATVQQTSILAYNQEIVRLGKREHEVLEGYSKYPERTDRELTKILEYADPNAVRPRRKALLDAGLVFDAGLKKCSVSGKVVHCWRVSERGRDVLFSVKRKGRGK